MAKCKVFSVYDSKVSAWMQPFTMLHTGQATRSWEATVNDPSSMISKHPTDFSLFEIGSFDDEKGVLQSHQAPIHVMSALEAVKKPHPELPLAPVN